MGRLFNLSNSRKSKKAHFMSVVLLFTVNNLILSIGIAGKEGATNLSAELLLQMHKRFIVRAVIKSIKAKTRNKTQEKNSRYLLLRTL